MEQVKGNNNNSAGAVSKPRSFAAGILTGVLITTLIAGAAFGGFLQFGKGSSGGLASTGLLGNLVNRKKSAVNDQSIEKLRGLEQIINEYYYEPENISVEDLETGLYKGLFKALGDPYTEYYTQEETEELEKALVGYYYGIGAYISQDQVSGYPMISGVIKNTPAEEAGLLAGDVIYKVNDEAAAGLSLDEVVSRVRGEAGTTVHLTIYREGESDYLEFDVGRRKVDSPSIESEVLEDDIGYIQIAEFTEVSAGQFDEALADLYSEKIKGLVIDLRNNPGGDVDAVTSVARQLLPEGIVFYMEDKDNKRVTYKCDGKNEIKIPLVLIVNGNSASASEILSGAVKDSGIGTILGTQTYGKGVVQTMYSLNDGSTVKITTADYYTRNGNNIHKIGIEPDITVEFDSEAYREDGTDNQLDAAIEEIRKALGEGGAGKNDLAGKKN